jgi:hypothetical protein
MLSTENVDKSSQKTWLIFALSRAQKKQQKTLKMCDFCSPSKVNLPCGKVNNES